MIILWLLKVYSLISSLILTIESTQIHENIIKNDCAMAREGEFIKDRYACEKFYQCRNGVGIPVSCPTGMYFDSKIQICEIANHVQCIPEQYPQTDEIICPIEDKIDVVFVASKKDCHQYYICYHGVAIQQECIAELHWNERFNRCDFPENVNCKIDHMPKCPEKGTQIFPHPTECNYYIYCINGFRSLQQCPFYHQWDFNLNMCVLKNQRSRC